MSAVATAPSSRGVFSRDLWLTTLGMGAIIGIAAFENLAVTTVMPIISAQLHGQSLYTLAFAAPLATGLAGMVIAGNWADRSGPRVVVVSAVVVFAIGLLVVGLSPTMTMLLIGRLVQGFGAGAVTVALYVMVARVYPPALHGSIFAGFAAAWVVPALVGPLIAGIVTQAFSWHWVFLGALGLSILAFASIVPTLRTLGGGPADGTSGDARVPWSVGRILWSMAAAAGVLVLNLAADFPLWLGVTASIVAIVVVVIALRPLLPPRTFISDRGLPSLVLLRGLVAGAFLGSEVYLPYLLSVEYHFTPSASGVTLTFSALAWALASWLQGRLGERIHYVTSIRLGSGLVALGLATAIGTATLHLAPAVVIVGWTLAGFGMGFMYPRFGVLALGLSTDENRGFNSSAMTISDSTGIAIALAVTGAVFGALGGATHPAAFGAAFGVTLVLALLAVGVSGRGRVRVRD